MRHDPADPQWPDRDRFVLSAGHGSMLLYAALHLSGYDLSLDEIKRFRQWGSLTPGHPERDRVHVTPGVEVTTGPLGQGFANGVGMAMAERFLRERYGSEIQDHHVYAIVSDGDLMEGVASEACVAGRPHRPRPARLPLRRQRHLARRTDLAELHDRGRHQALRGLRLARPGGPRRQRPHGAAHGRPRRAARRGPPVARPGQVDHRLPLAEQERHVQGPRLAARRRRGPRDQRRRWAGTRRRVPRPRRRSTRRSPPGTPASTPHGASASTRGARSTPSSRRSGTAPGRTGPPARRPARRASGVHDKIATAARAARR